MIFAAGLGTRLKPLTDTLPKALVPVCGKPLIEHVLLKLKSQGIDEAVVNVHHFAEKVLDWIGRQEWICSEASDKAPGKMLVQVSDERKRLLETGGAVLAARQFLEGCGSFLIHNVDILSDLDIRWFASQIPQDAMATLLVSKRQSSRQLLFDPQTMRLVGWRNTLTGEIRSPYHDLEPEAYLSLAFSGIHIMSDKIFEAMDDYVSFHSLDLGGEPARFPVIDFYLWACAYYNIYGVCAKDLHLIDVGKLDTIEQAEQYVSSMK